MKVRSVSDNGCYLKQQLAQNGIHCSALYIGLLNNL